MDEQRRRVRKWKSKRYENTREVIHKIYKIHSQSLRSGLNRLIEFEAVLRIQFRDCGPKEAGREQRHQECGRKCRAEREMRERETAKTKEGESETSIVSAAKKL